MKSIKLFLTGIFLIIIGALVCGASFVLLGLDIRSLNTSTYVTRTYDAGTEFENISVRGDTENINFVLSDDGKCYVVCRELENNKHDVKVADDTLCIYDISSFSLQFGFFSEGPEMTVYLPKADYSSLSLDSDTGDVYIPEDFSFGDVSIKLDTGALVCNASADGNVNVRTDTGKITLQGMTPEALTVNTDTGHTVISNISCSGETVVNVHTARVELTNVSCTEFSSTGSTGNLLLTDVVSTGRWTVKRDTGSVSFENCDAADISIKTDTGNVAGSLLSGKIFDVSTDTGKVNVPGSSEGGKCEITSDTGNIDITIRQ